MNLKYKEIRKHIPEFLEVYKNRPIENNRGGMMLPHLYATWFMLRDLNPDIIIESGTFKGLGTWIMEQACRKAKIISIDIKDQREYISEKVRYLTEDITKYGPWSNGLPIKTVIHFDDHMNAIERIKWCKKMGFKHLIFEDNYPAGEGDCVSLKQNPEFVAKNTKQYYEFPPIFRPDPTRWGYSIPMPEPVCSNVTVVNKSFFEEAKWYTWICYVEL